MLSETEWTTFVLNANCTDTHTLSTQGHLAFVRGLRKENCLYVVHS